MNRNLHMEYAKRLFRRVKAEILDKKLKQDMQDGLDSLNSADYLYEKWIDEAKMIGVRNPSFDGDMVGWLDDDFEEDDEDHKGRKL